MATLYLPIELLVIFRVNVEWCCKSHQNLGKRGRSTFSRDCIFLGRPWGLRDDSSPSFSAALEVQAFVPNGVPRRTQWRTVVSSFSVIGRFTRSVQSASRGWNDGSSRILPDPFSPQYKEPNFHSSALLTSPALRAFRST